MICVREVFNSRVRGEVDYLEDEVEMRYLVRPKGIARQPFRGILGRPCNCVVSVVLLSF